MIIELIDEHIWIHLNGKKHHPAYPNPTFHHIMIYDKNTLGNQNPVSLNTLTPLFKIKIPLVEPYKFKKFFAKLFHVKKDNTIILKRKINKKYTYYYFNLDEIVQYSKETKNITSSQKKLDAQSDSEEISALAEKAEGKPKQIEVCIRDQQKNISEKAASLNSLLIKYKKEDLEQNKTKKKEDLELIKSIEEQETKFVKLKKIFWSYYQSIKNALLYFYKCSRSFVRK